MQKCYRFKKTGFYSILFWKKILFSSVGSQQKGAMTPCLVGDSTLVYILRSVRDTRLVVGIDHRVGRWSFKNFLNITNVRELRLCIGSSVHEPVTLSFGRNTHLGNEHWGVISKNADHHKMDSTVLTDIVLGTWRYMDTMLRK